MRLLDTSTLGLHEFMGNIPLYAILSHRWEEEEVSFQDLRDGNGPKMMGYSKIEKCCAQALMDGWKYVWIDSCCIDKTSSSELSEAINSMYQWYAQAQICYAYLSDVPSGGTQEAREQFFRSSKWFTRGWTLQELLAPYTIIFFSGNWVDIGTKASLGPLLRSITGVKDLLNFEKASVAQKMSWASKRQTTRVEDTAYCLLGLFGISMPLLYGEGENAFLRLQLEILKTSDDESIFAWDDVKNWTVTTGMLAQNPSFFERSEDIQQYIVDNTRSPYEMTNKGLRMDLSLVPLPDIGFQRFVAPLNCARGDKPLAIVLACSEDSSRTRWFRTDRLLHWNASRTTSIKKTILVEQSNAVNIYVEQPYIVLVQILDIVTKEGPFYVAQQYPDKSEHPTWFQAVVKDYEALRPSVIGFPLGSGTKKLVAALLFTAFSKESFVVAIYDLRFNLGVKVLAAPKDLSWKEYVQLLESFHNPSWPSHPILDIGNLADRTSRLLRNGKSVSVVVKRQGTRADAMYLVEIRVHMDGRLEWPTSND